MNFVKTLWPVPIPRAAPDAEKGWTPPARLRTRRRKREGTSVWHLLTPIVLYVGTVVILAMDVLPRM